MSSVAAPARSVPVHARRLLYLVGGVLFFSLFALIAYPSLVLIWNSVQADDQFTLANFSALLNPRVLTALRNSLVVSFWGTLGATALGVSLAWLMARTDVRWKRLWQTLIVVPYLIPPFIGAIAWVSLLGPVGYINQWARSLTGGILFNIYGEAGIIFVLILYTYPIAYLICVGPLRQMPPTLEEAARMSGAGPLRTLRDVTLPLIWPNIGASVLLVFMSMMANFGIPAVIGFPRRYFVLTNEIYTVILNFDRANNLQIAAALSMVLVVLALVTLLLQRWLRAGRRYTILSGKTEQPRLLVLGRWQGLVLLALALLVLLTVVAPMLAILATSITQAPGVPLTLETATLRHYDELLRLDKVGRSLLNSLTLAAGAATVIVVMGFIIAYLNERRGIAGRQLIEAVVLLPYAVPGTVVALAMILAFLPPLPLLNVSLYNTIWILLIAYIARFLTFGVQAVSAAFTQVSPSLEEAARMSGADTATALKDITLPLVWPSLLAGWFLAFIPALTELTLSVLLFSVGNETLGQVVFGLNQEGKVNLTAALAFLVTLFVLVLNAVINRLTRGRSAAV